MTSTYAMVLDSDLDREVLSKLQAGSSNDPTPGYKNFLDQCKALSARAADKLQGLIHQP
jgi:hypothetical protein